MKALDSRFYVKFMQLEIYLLSIEALLILKEKKISMIRTLKYRKQKKIERFEKQQFNKLFDNSQGKVYDKFVIF